MWFPEPETPDPSYRLRREAIGDWLARSTVALASDYRRFLNENLAAFSLVEQERLVHDLGHRWESAFFELIVARTMQLLGGSVSIETATSGGHRPDFRVEFPDRSIIVEAVCPQVNLEARGQDRDRAPLLDVIESCAPRGWAVMVRQLPQIGPNASKRGFKAAVRDMLSIGPPCEGQQPLEISRDTDDGLIELALLPSEEAAGLAGWAGTAFWDDTETRIRSVLKRKRRQVRDSHEPVVLAVQAGGAVSTMSDFDHALYGKTATLLGENLEVVGQRVEPDGLFARRSSEPPTYSGLLAFTAVHFGVCTQPVLYRHPRFNGEFPKGLVQLEERTINPERTRILAGAAVSDQLLAGLHLVDSRA